MHKGLFVEDMGPKRRRLGHAARSAGTRSVLLVHLRRHCFGTKIILPICLYSTLYNLLRASAIQTATDNKSMWMRLEPQISGPFVICGARTPIHSGGGCASDWLRPHDVPWALFMKSKYCIFLIKKVPNPFFPPFLLFQGSHSKVKPMTIPMGIRHQITFCNILLKHKTKP